MSPRISSSTSPSGDEFLEIKRLNDLDVDTERRLNKFVRRFEETTQLKPDFVVSSPGRINLIGDHIDYHGFAVLPMAIENSVLIGCSLGRFVADSGNWSKIRLYNSRADLYPSWTGDHSLSYGAELNRSHQWHHYVLCGYHGTLARSLLNVEAKDLYEHSKRVMALDKLSQESLSKLPDFTLLVDSNLPPASGLSSSSALVCASAIATSWLISSSEAGSFRLNERVNARELAEDCAKFELLIGTCGGGMDQAIIMTAQEGYAKFVEFVPRLKCDNVRLPDETVWLVSHCGVEYPKAANPGYNIRVFETRLAATIIAKYHGAEFSSSLTLSQVRQRFYEFKSAREILSDIRAGALRDLEEPTVDQVAERLEMSRCELGEKFNVSQEFIESQLNCGLQLLSRCEHIFEEAERVERFKSICDTTVDLTQLGQLMSQSHYSLRDKYDCSHPALDRLVSVALDAGALGARLTGAGWGGCIVALVEVSKCDTVFHRLREVSEFTFKTEPCSGSHVISLSNE